MSGLRSAVAAGLALLYVAPWVGALGAVARLAWGDGAEGYRALMADPQTLPALASSVATGGAATVLALAAAAALTVGLHGRPGWDRLQRAVPALLAVPHAALAVGLALLVMPSGLIARGVAMLAGWADPPDWPTVHDPAGLLLIAVLVLKELPFLLWSLQALLDRPDVAAVLSRQRAAARTLGHRESTVWWTVLLPAWGPALAGPLLAVGAYAVTVVDVAWLVGPTTPPTLAVLSWQWLQDADPQRQAQGAAAAVALTVALVVLAIATTAALAALAMLARRQALRGPPRPAVQPPAAGRAGRLPWARWCTTVPYALAALALALASGAGWWPFPALWPERWTAASWVTALEAVPTLGFSAALGAAAAATALALGLLWCTTAPPAWDRRALPWLVAPIVLPGLLLAAGLYRVSLALQWDGRWLGLWAVHTLLALPYVLLVLLPAWRRHDPRWRQAARVLGRGRWATLWRVQRPMLQAPMAAALAVGFAVSVAQYLPTVFVGAGVLPTITTEAVTLTAGGQRSLGAAFALLQALLPLAGFAAAAAVSARARAWERHA